MGGVSPFFMAKGYDYVELINFLWYNRRDVYINGEAT